MKISEDDKWYINETAQAALPALIRTITPPSMSGPEMANYARNLGVLAHLIGLQMFNGREQMLATIEKSNQKQ